MHENFKGNEATLSIHDILSKREKGAGVLDFRNEDGQLRNCRTHIRQIVAGRSRSIGTGGIQLTGPCLKPYLPDLIQIRLLRGASQDSLPGAAFLSEPLGQKAGRATGSFGVFCFSITSLKSVSQKQRQSGKTLVHFNCKYNHSLCWVLLSLHSYHA